MTAKRWLYIAFGVVLTLGAGAVTNQRALARESAMTVTNDGLVFPDGTVQATAAPRDQRRAFYLTASNYSSTSVACAAGFHFASIWEISEVSTLRYATAAEGGLDVFQADDAGAGPPAGFYGWARTGYWSYGLDVAKIANCLAWTDATADNYGSAFALVGGAPDGHPWLGTTVLCSQTSRAWCVEDYPGAASP